MLLIQRFVADAQHGTLFVAAVVTSGDVDLLSQIYKQITRWKASTSALEAKHFGLDREPRKNRMFADQQPPGECVAPDP